MEKYRKIEKIGQGAHGSISKFQIVVPSSSSAAASSPTATATTSAASAGTTESQLQQQQQSTLWLRNYASPYVAIKKIHVKDNQYGLSQEAIREIKYMLELNHPNILRVLEVFNYQSNVNIVLEFMEGDLETVIRDKTILFSPADIKSYMLQMCRALEYVHSRWLIHRDIKPSNFLIAPDGTLKLADFGLARFFGSPPARLMTKQVYTSWYRPPELIFGATSYGPASDMWALGCIFGELLLREPLFPAESEMEVLRLQFSRLGVPTEQEWPGAATLPGFLAFKPCAGNIWPAFQAASSDALDLLKSLLKHDAAQRITAAKALQHPYFHSAPLPTAPDRLPRPKKSLKPIVSQSLT